MLTYDDIRGNRTVNAYIQAGNDALGSIRYTEHGFAHAARTAETAAAILTALEYDGRTVELAKISGYIHDIGNMVNRENHALTGGTLAFTLLTQLGMEPEEIAIVVSAVGNHDELSGNSINAVSAALAIADKSDVRRSRVRTQKTIAGSDHIDDIHDRVNYAAVGSRVVLDKPSKTVTLELEIDTAICAVMDYFEIFLKRMLMSRRAAEYLGLQFHLVINGTAML